MPLHTRYKPGKKPFFVYGRHDPAIVWMAKASLEKARTGFEYQMAAALDASEATAHQDASVAVAAMRQKAAVPEPTGTSLKTRIVFHLPKGGPGGGVSYLNFIQLARVPPCSFNTPPRPKFMPHAPHSAPRGKGHAYRAPLRSGRRAGGRGPLPRHAAQPPVPGIDPVGAGGRYQGATLLVVRPPRAARHTSPPFRCFVLHAYRRSLSCLFD